MAPEELNPPYQGPLQLWDVETGEFQSVFLDDQALQSYQENLQRFRREWRLFCTHQKIFYAFVTSDMSLPDLLQTALSEL
jgi:hypothetical protein